MGISVETLAVAKKYTKESIEGITGSLAGKNATIDSITDITGGHRVTFKWTADNGDVRTQPMDVMDGSKGDKGETGDAGLGIKAVNINAQSHLIITYDDDSTYDAGELPGGSGEVISVNGKKGVVTLDANDVGALPDDTELFSGDYNDLDNLPDLTNFITNTVDNLINYYKKTETYTKTEVDNIANTIKNGRFEVVATLPTTDIKTNVIYLVPKSTAQASNIKDEYINLDGTTAGWEKIGDTEIDLSGYVTTTALNTALAAYTTTTDLTTLLADKVDKVTGKGLSTNDYTNTDKELVDSIPTLAPISFVKDTVGWTGKNLLKNTATTQTIDGVTFTVNSDGSVTANGTGIGNSSQLTLGDRNDGVNALRLKKGKYTINGSVSVGNIHVATSSNADGSYLEIPNANSKNGNDATFEITDTYLKTGTDYCPVSVYLQIGANVANNLTFYPMIRRADITDPTYEPYHESVEVMYEEEIHGVNLLKNEATTQTINGVTFTVNSDKSVTVNGTATATANFALKMTPEFDGAVILSGCPSGGAANKYSIQYSSWVSGMPIYADYGEGVLIPNAFDKSTYPNARAFINITNGQTVNNLIFKPMLRKADIEDSTYRPYNYQAIQNQLNAQGVLGAKNLLPNTATSQTVRGVTFTVNSDGSVTANGTATGGNASLTNWGITLTLPAGKYIFSGCPSGGGANTYALLMQDDPYTQNIFDYGDGVVIDISETKTFHPYFGYVREGVTVSNLTFKPMLRLASDPDDTYQPYAMTNRELTEEGPTIKTHLVEWNEDLNLGSSTNKGGSIVQYGKLYFVTYWFKATTALTGNTPIIKLPKNGLTGGNYVITEGNDTAIWGGKSTKDGIDYVSISCPIVVDKVYRSQCVWMDLT